MTERNCCHCGGSGEDQNKLNDPGPCMNCNGTGAVIAAPDSCPHCIDSDDCSHAVICSAVQHAYQ